MPLQFILSYIDQFKQAILQFAGRTHAISGACVPRRRRPRISGLLIDVSGNLHVGDKPTPRAVAALEKLRKSAIPYRLCSNSSKESTQSLIGRLCDLGFHVSRYDEQGQQVTWTSLGALVQLVKDKGLKRPYLLLSSSAKEEFHGSGIQLDSTETHDSVVVGLAPKLFDYDHLNQAFRILKGEVPGRQPSHDHIPLIATHKAKYIQTESGLSLGPGPFVSALEEAANTEAVVVGKPTRSFFEIAIKGFPVPVQTSPGRIAVIGDDVEADLGGGALDLNLWRILVRTGKYREGDDSKPGVTPPDEVFDDFASFIDSLLDGQEPA